MALEFQAFMDESESHEEFILGGYMAPANVWARFAKDWGELLPLGTIAKNGKPHFKMSEMAKSAQWSGYARSSAERSLFCRSAKKVSSIP